MTETFKDILTDSPPHVITKKDRILNDLSDNEILKLLLHNQLDIKDTQVEMSKSQQRIFDLYQKHEEWLRGIQRAMDKRESSNGHTKKDLKSLEDIVAEFNRTRQPIVNDITELKAVKADKKDINDVLIVVTEIKTTLEDHCEYEEKYDKKVKEDLNERLADHDRWYNNRVNQLVIVLAIIGIIIGFFQVQGGWHL
jgi:Mg2+ and Co2+ transporter CorA